MGVDNGQSSRRQASPEASPEVEEQLGEGLEMVGSVQGDLRMLAMVLAETDKKEIPFQDAQDTRGKLKFEVVVIKSLPFRHPEHHGPG